MRLNESIGCCRLTLRPCRTYKSVLSVTLTISGEQTMRTLRQLCAAVVLTLAFAASASAGTMWPGVVSPTPTPEPTQSASTSEDQTAQADGTTHTGVAESEPDAVTEIALNLLQSVLSLI
jgi:hypothetical protein